MEDSLWLWLPSLELSSREFPNLDAFASFGDRFFDSNRASCIHNFKLSVDVLNGEFCNLKSWIEAAVKRKIQHLLVHCRCYFRISYEMPRSLYSCETLVSLELYYVTLANAEFVSLPSLKTMHLMYIVYPNEATFERLVSSCPFLEDLKVFINKNDLIVIRVHSRSLKRLRLQRRSCPQFESVPGVVIDAPLLCFLSVDDSESESFIVNNMESNAKLDISLFFGLEEFDEASVSSKRNSIRGFLPGISRVMDMKISPLKAIYNYSKLKPLPQFLYLSRLHVALHASDLKSLPTFLECCPNLKSLLLALYCNKDMHSEEVNESFSSVPECLLSSLELVDILYGGYAVKMKLVKYFLENSAMLKKLTLGLDSPSTKDDILKNLLKIPRRSTTCEVKLRENRWKLSSD